MYPKGSTPDYYVTIDNVAITKESEPPSVEWDILGIETPEVRVVLAGLAEGQEVLGQTLSQDTGFQTIQWGTAGINTPSDWVPIICGTYSTWYHGFADFTFDITYSTMGTVPCRIFHELAK